MTQPYASQDPDARRSIARRTAWIVGGIELAVYLGAIIEVVLKR